MGDLEQGNAVERVISKLRKVTKVTQMAPFVYLLFLALYLLTMLALPDWALLLAGKVFTIPIHLIVCMLALGRLLKLCKWYITACILPLFPKIVSYIDSYVITLWYEEVVVFNTIIGVGYIVFLVFAYHHFFGCYGRKEDAV